MKVKERRKQKDDGEIEEEGGESSNSDEEELKSEDIIRWEVREEQGKREEVKDRGDGWEDFPDTQTRRVEIDHSRLH